MKKPKMPAPTEAEIRMRQMQSEELARLDEEENVRLKRLLRSRGGSRSLIRGRALTLGGVSRAGGGSLGGGAAIPSTPRPKAMV